MKLPAPQSILSALQRTKALRQKRVLFPVIALALAASVVAGREKPSPPPVAAPAARIDTRLQAAELDIDLSGLERQAQAAQVDPARNPFARRNFAPEQAPQSAGAGRPAAPALPFVYLGKMIDDGKLAVFLSRGEKSYSLHAGERRAQQLDDEYRVDKVTENRITFTHLPSKTRQTLDIPAVK